MKLPNKNHSRYRIILPVIFSLTVFLSACSAGRIPSTATAPAMENTPIPESSPTRKPSYTPQPSPTIFNSPTPTLEPSATLSPTPLPPPDDFSQVKFISFGQLPDWTFLFSFEFPSPVKGNYYVETVDPRKEYPCRPLLEYNLPKRMVCIGQTPAIEKTVEFNVKDSATGAILYSGKIAVPFKY